MQAVAHNGFCAYAAPPSP